MKQNDHVIPISIAMPVGMARCIRVLAAQEDKSRSQFVRELLEKALPNVSDAQRQDTVEVEGCETINRAAG